MHCLKGFASLTEDEPGIGGTLKRRPEDFFVTEIPRSEPEGKGEYLHLFIEKRERLTTEVARLLSERANVPLERVSYAGLKDKHAITRQWFCLEGVTPEQVRSLDDENVGILGVDWHDRPLGRGKLAGNRFEIRIRDVDATSAVHARRILERLAATGAPNYVGEQRFGHRCDGHLLGQHLLLGRWQAFVDQLLGRPQPIETKANRRARSAYDRGAIEEALERWPEVRRFERQALHRLVEGGSPAEAVGAIDPEHRTLLLSAFQSDIFNRLLDRRLREGTLATAGPGDLLIDHETREISEATEGADAQRRVDEQTASPSGPQWGRSMAVPAGELGEREREALRRTGVDPQQFSEGVYTLEGGRRPYRMRVHWPDVSGGIDDLGPYVRVGFELERGCYATVLLREIMKYDRDA